MTIYPNAQNQAAGAIPVYLVTGGTAVSGSNALPTTAGSAGGGGYAPAAGTASTVTTGGTAVTVVTGPVNGGYITNPVNAAAQGIGAAENIYIDPVGTPGSTDSVANGTTVLLTPGQTYTIPSLTTAKLIKVNAATSGHKLTVVVW